VNSGEGEFELKHWSTRVVIDGKIEGRPEQDEIAATVAHLAQPRAHRRSPEVHLLS
jgi:hypothetical protein